MSYGTNSKAPPHTGAEMDAVTVARLAMAASKPSACGDTAKPFIITAEGQDVHDLESTLAAPLRKRGRVEVDDLSSFIDVTKRHRDERTVVYFRAQPSAVFEAVLNDHAPSREGEAGWGDHVVHYACPLSTEWKTWLSADKKFVSQESFALFVENNLPDFVEPPAADMLELSRTFSAKKKANFSSGIRLDNGQQQLTYVEEIQGAAGGKGQIRIPEFVKLGLTVFENGDRYEVLARFRYRIADGGALMMAFDLERPHKIVEDAVIRMVASVEEDLGLKLIRGQRQ